MRTTITLDDDVASRVEQLQRSTQRTFKEVVNDLLRQGLDAKPPACAKRRYRSRSFRAEPLVGNLDNVAEALAVAEGDDFR
jgi:Arc/MetJ family transcription regulator